MKENRKVYRARQVIRVIWRAGGIVSLGITRDVSQAGAFVMTERHTTPGATVELDFRPVAFEPIRTTGPDRRRPTAAVPRGSGTRPTAAGPTPAAPGDRPGRRGRGPLSRSAR